MPVYTFNWNEPRKGSRINTSAVINDQRRKLFSSRRRRATSSGSCSATQSKEEGAESRVTSSCRQHLCVATPGFDPFLFSPSREDCRLKGNVNAEFDDLRWRIITLEYFVRDFCENNYVAGIIKGKCLCLNCKIYIFLKCIKRRITLILEYLSLG